MSVLLDQYSYLHFASGITAYFIGFRLRTWFLLHLVVDLFENSSWGIQIIQQYLKLFLRPRYGSDPPLNIVMDNVIAILGWLSAYYLERYCLDSGYGTTRAKRK
jgi:hypothetical protein